MHMHMHMHTHTHECVYPKDKRASSCILIHFHKYSDYQQLQVSHYHVTFVLQNYWIMIKYSYIY